MRLQLRHYGVTPIETEAEAIQSLPQGGFQVRAGHELEATSVILATGVRDRVPPVDEPWSRIREGLIRQCPVCDAFELIDSLSP